MSHFSLVERLAVAATRLASRERMLFEDLFDRGLTREQICEERALSAQQYGLLHRSMMRSLCGVVGQAATAGAAVAPEGAVA